MQNTTLFWLNRTFDETLNLLEEAKYYNEHLIKRQVRHLMPIARLEVTAESLRVTSRLSHTMAWLITEKAILNDELDRMEAESLYRPLFEESTCLNLMQCTDDICPNGLLSLLDRSRDLFIRACRLENMLRAETTEPILVLT
ncbi:MAG: DUF1465 family protein [Methylocystaceae bacterium]|nr:DUF1465 family protein [Methylocystaceae bacterium]